MRILVFVFFLTLSLFAREITDMSGQKVTVPDNITRVYGSAPPSTYAVYAIDPSFIVGLNFSPAKGFNEASGLLDKRFMSLPIVGGLQGGVQGINKESLLAVRPQIVLAWSNDAAAKMSQKSLDESKIPTVYLDIEKIENIGNGFLFLGDLLDKKERAAKLAEYAKNVVANSKKNISTHKGKRPTVYYAEGTDGLATECEESSHYEAIRFAGGINPHKCKNRPTGMGLEKVSMEQVMGYNPDIIIAQEKAFFDSVKTDPKWKNIKAVKNGEIYLVPKVPFNWIDRPPSFMRLLGVQWLQKVIFKKQSDAEFAKTTKEFYKLFLNVNLSDSSAISLIGGK